MRTRISSLSLSQLQPKERANIIRDVLSVNVEQLASAEYFDVKEGKKTRVFSRLTSTSSIAKLFRPANTTTPWRAEYSIPFVLWLQQEQGYKNAPLTLFVANATTEEEFLDLLYNGDPEEKPLVKNSSAISIPKYRRPEENRVSLLIKQALAVSRDPEYFRKPSATEHSLAERNARDLDELLVQGDVLLPPDELINMGNILELCTGCGKGAEEYPVFASSFESQWDRLDELEMSLETDEHYIGLAQLGSRIVQGKIISGRLEEARPDAQAIEDWITRGLIRKDNYWGVALDARINQVLIESEIAVDIWIEEFPRIAANNCSENSFEYFKALKCRACRAISCGSPKARECVEDAKEAFARYETRLAAHSEHLEHERGDLAYLEIHFIAENSSLRGRSQGKDLRDIVGIEKLEENVKLRNAPIRNARALLLLWKATGRERTDLLIRAQRLAWKQPSLKHICLFSVSGLRDEITGALRIAGGLEPREARL